MSIGHGSLGFLSGLRGFPELIDEDGADRIPFVELRLGVELLEGQWIHHSGGTYRQRAHYVIDGVLRDILAVVVGSQGLTRMESLADCVATAGTYYFSGEDAALFPGSPGWDDDTNPMDAGTPFWDLYPPADLYVHLAAEASPSAFTIVALLGFYYSTKGTAHPTLGPNLYLNPGFESGLTSWTVSAPAGTIVQAQTAVVRDGVNAAQLTTDGSATGALVQAPGALKVGRRYRMSGDYLTPTTNAAGFIPAIFVGVGASFLLSDGRTYATSGLPPIFTPTAGDWRRFLFDFIAPDAAAAAGVFVSLDGDAGTIYLDNMQLRRIYRFNQYEARIAPDSIPELMTACARLFGTQTIGLSGVSFLNGNGDASGGYWESVLGQLLCHRKPTLVSVGGVFKDGTEVYRDAWEPRFAGLINDHEVEDASARLQLQDWRSFLKTEIPRNIYDTTVEPRSIGQPRPYVFGTKLLTGAATYYLRPARVAVDPTTGYGIYETTDPTIATANGVETSDIEVTSWLDEEAADKQATDGSGGFTVIAATYSYDAATARLSILKDVRPIKIPAQRYIDFTRNGSPFVAASGFGFAGGTFIDRIDKWCATLQANMRTASGSAGLTVTYDDTTHKVTIADPTATTFTLTLKTGANVANGFGPYIGFDGGADRTGALTYTADNALFLSADNNHVIRVAMSGYRDDASGTYTGSAGSVIKYPAHVAKFLISRALGVGDSAFDSSFSDPAPTGPSGYDVYSVVDSLQDADEVLAKLEAGAMAAIVMDGGGIFHWVPYSDTTSQRTFYERDFLAFKSGRSLVDVAGNVRVFFPQTAHGDGTVYRTIPQAEPRHSARTTVDVATFIRPTFIVANQLALTDKYLVPLSAYRRWVAFTARGKLAGLRVADLITVNRPRAVDPTGALAGVKFRIIALNPNDSAGYATCVALEYVEIP